MSVITDLLVEEEAWGEESFWRGIADKAFAQSLAHMGTSVREGAEISLLLCNDARMRLLNRDWRRQDKPTNVLSFPVPGPLASAFVLGDIAVSHETALREAKEEGKIFVDHVTHLLVHGFLHLLGYDHENDADAERMESLESQILAGMNVADPYSDNMNPEQAIPAPSQG